MRSMTDEGRGRARLRVDAPRGALTRPLLRKGHPLPLRGRGKIGALRLPRARQAHVLGEGLGEQHFEPGGGKEAHGGGVLVEVARRKALFCLFCFCLFLVDDNERNVASLHAHNNNKTTKNSKQPGRANNPDTWYAQSMKGIRPRSCTAARMPRHCACVGSQPVGL